MTKLERARELRADTARHYNCCQSVVLPFAEELGLDEEAVLKLAEHFGSGMRRGSVCGAVTGGLMALGLMGKSGSQDVRPSSGLFGRGPSIWTAPNCSNAPKSTGRRKRSTATGWCSWRWSWWRKC